MSEQEIIKGCLNNDRRSQNALYKLYYPLMKNIISRYAEQLDDQSILINSGFFKVLNTLDKYNNTYSLSTWIRHVMINNCIDEFRKIKNIESNILLEDLEEVPVAMAYNQGLKNMEDAELLLILNELPMMSRQVFNLFAIDGFKHQEIAELLQISSGTSRWHLNFARKRLQELLLIKQHSSQKIEATHEK